MRKLICLAATALLLLAGCRREPTAARVDPAIAPILPADTVLLAGLRLDRIQKTPFYQRYVAGPEALRFFTDFQKKTGVNLQKDIWELCLTATRSRQLIFVRGKFGGQFGLEPKADMPGLQRIDYKGYYILAQASESGPASGVLFFNTGVAVIGKVDDLKFVVDGRNTNPGPPKELLKLVETVPANGHAWAVSANAGSLLPKMKAEGEAAGFVRLGEALGEFKMWMDLSDGVNMRLEAQYPEEKLALQARDGGKALLGLARLRTPSDKPELLQVYSNIHISNEKARVIVNATTPLALIDQIVKLMARERPNQSSPEP